MPPRTRIRLTELLVKRQRPEPGKRLEFWDDQSPGLVLRISERGVKSYYFVRQLDKVRHKLHLGTYPDLSLSEARKKADVWKVEVAKGAAPAKARRVVKGTDPKTVDALMEPFLEVYKVDHKSWKEVERDLRNHALWRIGKLRPDRVSKEHIEEILDEVTEMPSVHNKVISHLSSLFKWAAKKKYVPANPVVGFERLDVRSRARVLLPAEVKEIWSACQGANSRWPWGVLTKFIFVVVQRRTAVAAIRRDQVDREQKLWVIPGAMQKSGRDHVVPLSDLALAILDECPVILDKHGKPSPYFFPARHRPDRPLSGFSDGKERLSESLEVNDWRLHDARRTFSTMVAAPPLSIPQSIIDRVLDHTDTNASAVAKIYNRYEYLAEKRDALDGWANRLLAIVT